MESNILTGKLLFNYFHFYPSSIEQKKKTERPQKVPLFSLLFLSARSKD